MDNSLKKRMEYINKLEQIDTEEIEPLFQLFENNNVYREDCITNSNQIEEIMSNAPEKEGDYFVVPKTFD